MGSLHTSAMAFISCLIFTLGEILLFSTLLVLVFNRASEANKGKCLGFYQSMFSIATMVAPIFGAYIYAIQPEWLWYSCGLIGILSLIIIFSINSKTIII